MKTHWVKYTVVTFLISLPLAYNACSKSGTVGTAEGSSTGNPFVTMSVVPFAPVSQNFLFKVCVTRIIRGENENIWQGPPQVMTFEPTGTVLPNATVPDNSTASVAIVTAGNTCSGFTPNIEIINDNGTYSRAYATERILRFNPQNPILLNTMTPWYFDISPMLNYLAAINTNSEINNLFSIYGFI